MAQTLTALYSIIIIIGTLANFSLLAAFCSNKARDSLPDISNNERVNCKMRPLYIGFVDNQKYPHS